MNEIWKPITGYEGLYEVSNLGRVRSLDRRDSLGRMRFGKVLKQNDDGNGYPFIALHNNGKTKQMHIHRIVANAFLGEMPNGYTVNHIDENKHNNHADNLEYLTPLDNLRHGTAIKRMGEKHRKKLIAKVISTGEVERYNSLNEAAVALGCDRSNIGHAANKRQKQACGRTWEFETV